MIARRRNRLFQLALIALICLLGINSRRFGAHLPWLIASYSGDTLWALAAFLGTGLLLPRASTGLVACLALIVSLTVECSQLYHAPWIDAIRRTTPGGLLLGYGFLWSDLACYAAGVGIGVMFEKLLVTSADAGTSSREAI